MKSLIIIFFFMVLILISILLLYKPKLPVSMVVLQWDYDKIVQWLEENQNFLKPRKSGMTFLHDIAQYRKYFKEKDTDYEKLQKLIFYYLDHGGSPSLKNNEGLTAYDLAIRYDPRIAEMIKKEIK